MKLATTIAAGLLGAAFILFGSLFLLDMMPKEDPPPEGSTAALFMGAMVPSGWMAFVKVFQIIGGVLTAIPKTRVWGLIILGPIITNIVCFQIFATGGKGLLDPPVIVISALGLFLLWAERHAFLAMLKRPAQN